MGITEVLIPKDNVIALKDVPEKQLTIIIPVETIEDVLKDALWISLPRIEHLLDWKFYLL